MSLRFYPAFIVAAEDGGFGVVFPDLPGCVSAGPTVDEAAHRAIEALSTHLAGLAADYVRIPMPSRLDAPLPDWLEDTSVVVRVMVPA
jgi:predicted RNase H-like HicB family nuclease